MYLVHFKSRSLDIHHRQGHQRCWCRIVQSTSNEGEALRDQIATHFQEHDDEKKDHGFEMGLPVPTEPPWLAKHYIFRQPGLQREHHMSFSRTARLG
jgi:hypothetical protein